MENKQLMFDERTYIYMVKAIALLSIVSAHVGIISEDVLLARIFLLLLNSLGTIGVCVFFMISGYLYHTENRSVWNFFKRKFYTVLVPWMFCGTLLFCYVTFRKGDFSFFNWMRTIFVYSHLYYLTVLFLFYLLFRRIQKSRYWLMTISVLSVASIILTGRGVLDGVYPYINPMNWAVYFVIGIFIREKRSLGTIAYLCKKYVLVLCAVYGVILGFYLYRGQFIGYWALPSFFIELVAAGCIFGLSHHLIHVKYRKFFLYIGKNSFSIYLLHTPVAGVLTYLLNVYNLWYFIIVSPAVIVLLTLGFLVLLDKAAGKINIQKGFRMLTGLRD